MEFPCYNRQIEGAAKWSRPNPERQIHRACGDVPWRPPYQVALELLSEKQPFPDGRLRWTCSGRFQRT